MTDKRIPTILKPIQWIYCIYALVLFIAIMLLIFPFVLIASLFGNIKGGNIIYRLIMVWADLWFPLSFIFHRNIYEEEHDYSKPYIYVINHISYLDAAIVPKAIRKPVRPLGKVEMSKVPVFGYIYRKVVVTVDRSDAAHRLRSIRRLKALLRKQISILFFPEGTFNLTKGEPLKNFYDGAFRIAIETGTPIRPVLFLDAYDRMHYRHLFTLTPGRNRVLFMKEVPVDGLTLADASLLRDRVYSLMAEKLREHKVSWIGKN